jgi:mannose-P-dolichol utilization defect protein 1
LFGIRFGENLSLLAQNAILVLMAWRFCSTPVHAKEKIMVVLGFGLYIVGVLNFLPEDMRYLLMSSTWPVMLYARGSQVLATFQDKHTGQLSIVTTSMNLVGSLIRIGTTLKETGDMVVLSGYILSGVLSFLMFVQHFLYLSNTKKEMKSSQEKKTE